ncbi:MAG: AAA family ATPase [Nostoc sp. DedQUE01]|nr:hypothetical protein [Nostoc sp. DedQUE01]
MFNNNSESNINIAHDANGVVGQNISGNITQYFISHESKVSIHNRKLVTFSPYVGLEKFQTKDKEKFFGRQAWITKLNQHLKQKNVLLLLGASGSGKSSLIRAGLITNLEDNWGDFINLTFEPDIDVFKSLYSSLQSNRYKQSELDIALGDNNLVQVVKKLKRDSRWLIFIDQFEELFTRTRKPERDNFVASLMQLIEEQDNSVKIVLTMRADFLDKFSPYPQLGNIHDNYSYMLTDMSDSELMLEDARRWSRLLRKNPQKAEEELWKESKLRQIQELIKKQIILALNDEANKFLDASMLLAQGIEVHSLLNPQDTQNGLVLAIKAIDENLDKLPEQILAPIQLGLYRAIKISSASISLLGHQALIRSVVFSPDGQMLVSASDDNTLRLWDVSSGKPIGEPLQGHEAAVGSVAFHPNGQMLVSGSADNTLRLWDISGSAIGEPLQGHLGAISSLAFSPDGQMIVSGSSDNTLRLWDISGSPIGEPLQGHQASINSVAFSPDGQIIVSGSSDGTVRLWGIYGNPIAEFFFGRCE